MSVIDVAAAQKKDGEMDQNLLDLALQYLDDLVQFHGSAQRVAEMLGASRQAVYNWKNRKSVPGSDNFQAIVNLAVKTLPKHMLRGDAEMLMRETAEVYGIDVEFQQATVTQGAIYIRQVSENRRALCRQIIPNTEPPPDTLFVYGDMVCEWSHPKNDPTHYVLQNIDGREIYILDTLPDDVVLGQIVPFRKN